MRTHYGASDVRTLRLLHEYGFTDHELSDHLGLSPLVVRRMRNKLGLHANGAPRTIAHDRRVAAQAATLHPAQPHLGGHRRSPAGVLMKLVDDRYFVEA